MKKLFLIGLAFYLVNMLLSCRQSDDKRFSDPLLNGCKDAQDDSAAYLIRDTINNLSFKMGPQWKIMFNDSLKVTNCMDTIAFDKFSQVRTLVINSVSSNKNLDDFFDEELKFMNKDSALILHSGYYTIDNLSSRYVIIESEVENLTINNAFFYVKVDDRVVIIQSAVNESKDPIQKFCSTMPIVNSINFGVL